jgi:DNA polymerase I
MEVCHHQPVPAERRAKPSRQTRPLLIVDGDNLAHRAYHSTPKTVTGAGVFKGEPINAIVGFFGMLLGVWTNERPRAVFVAWDTLTNHTYRTALWPAYQSGRVFETEIVRQLDALPDLCRAFGFGVGQRAGSEADDLMAAAAAKELQNGDSCLLLTTDRDSYQLVSGRVTVLSPKRGASEMDRIGPHEVVERLGVPPALVPDFKALSGDASDKIPGLRGIGPKTAAALLREHGTLEAALQALVAQGRPDETKLALTFRVVARWRPKGPARLPAHPPPGRRGATALRAIGASNLARRVGALAD